MLSQQEKTIQLKKDELFQYEKLLDNIDQDLANIKKSSPEDYERFKEFALKKKRQTKESIKSLKEEILELESKKKGGNEST